MLVALVVACAPVPAAPPAVDDLDSAIEAARRARVRGPTEVLLAGRTTLLVQAGVAWIPPAEGRRLLRALGVAAKGEIAGLALFTGDGDVSFAILYWREGGSEDIPEFGADGWTRAPALDALRPRQ